MKKYKYKMTIAYDGTNYHGWQIQKNKITIQDLIQNEISKILNSKTQITGSGRTDAKVHARGQVAHFIVDQKIPIQRFKHSLNSLLPKDIRVIKIEEVDLSFHARFSAKSKVYSYHISHDPTPNPFSRFYAYQIKKKLDINLLKKACSLFIGKHDFTSFANKQLEGSAKKNPIRTIQRIAVIEQKNKIIIEFEGDGFLYKMVRNIVGTLLDVESKKLPIDMIEKIIKAKDRTLASKPAEPQGLFLDRVEY
ncbi:MAG: tRNA pseudouridine synthase A [Candidatus Anoxychlamydiales bacterium]|nr:tRNA pseudouridine synthase A [Candidatus Anoxychlamydiales bacterium]